MGSGKFRFQVIVRVLLLGLMITALVYVVANTNWVFTTIVFGAAVCASVADLILYVERTNREFTLFLLSIKNSDFSAFQSRDKRGHSFTALKEAFNMIATEFQRVRIDREANYTYLQTMVGHMDTAIISFDETGEVKLMNEAAGQLLRMPYLKNIRSLQSTYPVLGNHLLNLAQGKSVVAKATIGNEQLQLSIRATELTILGDKHKLVSIQNIKSELEHTEAEAWEQLIHVLTHEIMNSVTPISSLSATLKKKSDELLQAKQGDHQTMDDLAQGLKVIERRSIGLMNFVSDYRSLTHIPVPDIKEIMVADLFENLKQLKGSQLSKKGIRLQFKYTGKNIPVACDQELIEQVLINLVNNAEDALKEVENPEIELSAEAENGKTIIRIKDNGAGMDGETREKIFVPFFTTKKTGSGIGLSLTRQIMRMHSGSVSVHSEPSQGSVFSLIFN
jgi:two-component system nitrogen regulation sensor histidine kinase NtrY